MARLREGVMVRSLRFHPNPSYHYVSILHGLLHVKVAGQDDSRGVLLRFPARCSQCSLGDQLPIPVTPRATSFWRVDNDSFSSQSHWVTLSEETP